jgi:uroporphyrin-III C-methyltransferase/precorrin-2 dehydrogenase/sirohydrochlorin ferrochelatase
MAPPADSREPRATPAPALADLDVLPVFFRLAGRRVVVAGGGDGAAWKAELLAATGALVDVYAAPVADRLRALAAARGSVTLHERDIRAEDFEGAALAVCDAADDARAEGLRREAASRGVPCNIVDKPAHSDFQFGAIVERSPVVVAISTGGGAPVFAQMLRTRIETLLPQGFRRWAAAAKEWRPAVAALDLGHATRRSLWERFAKLAFDAPERAPTRDDLAALIDSASARPEQSVGSVTLIGAGPGDPELLTLKAVRALQAADVVLYDDLVMPGSLDFARREATRLSVGKRGYKPSCTQEDISDLMVSLARQGKRVARLKGGDPMVFGRAGEEIAALRAAGVSVEVVPGVTAASAAAAALRSSLTERALARRLQFITAHTREGKLPEDLDWRALADPGATSVVYMGLKTLPALAARLIAEGLPPDTPAALVERASWPDERRVLATIADLPGRAALEGAKSPCVVMIGRALGGMN